MKLPAGALIDSAGIVAGGLWAALGGKNFSPRLQLLAKGALGAATVWCGLQLTWKSLNGTFAQVAKELGIALLAMALGQLTGRLLRLQKCSNSIGRYAGQRMAAADPAGRVSGGFVLATALYCAAPLAFLASTQEGLESFSPVFVIKAVTDLLAAAAFYLTFGWGSVAAAVPVFLFQGSLIQTVQRLEPWLRHQPWPLVDSINAVDGLLIFCVALLMLDARKVRVADYLPALVWAPVLTRLLW